MALSRFVLPYADVGAGIRPSSGAKLFFYATGTSTFKSTFTDATGSTANTNPVIANANGVFPGIFLEGVFNIALKDANDVQIWTEETYTTSLFTLPVFSTVAAMVASTPTALDGVNVIFTVGMFVSVVDYATGNNSGVLFGSIVAGGTGTADGGSYINLANGTQWRQNFNTLAISVKQFGAEGSGGVGDIIKIQAAIDYAATLSTSSNKILVQFPTDSYLVTTSVLVPENIILDGNGSRLSTNNNIKLVTLSGSRSGCKNFILNGPGDASYSFGSDAIFVSGVFNFGASPTYISDVVIENNLIDGFGYAGIFLNYVINAQVNKNRVSNVGYVGIGGTSCESSFFDGNHIFNIDQGSAGGDSYGIFVDRSEGYSLTEAPRSIRINITNNNIYNITGGVNAQAIDTHGGFSFVVDGNNIEDCKRGIFITASSLDGAQALGPKDIVVSNNVVKTSTGGYGILVSGAIDSGTIIEHAENCVVSGNTVYGYGVSGDSIIGAVQLQATKDIVVNGNVIKDSHVNGVLLGAGNIGFSITNNIITDPYDASLTPNCIVVVDDDNRGLITGNTYVFLDSSLSTNVAVNAIKINTSLTGLALTLGQSSFIGIDASHLAVVIGTTTGVKYRGLSGDSGQATVALTDTVSNGITTVTFSERLPYIPTISLSLRHPFNQGGKSPILAVDTAVAVSTTQFRIYAYPSDLGAWTATGDITVDWDAD